MSEDLNLVEPVEEPLVEQPVEKKEEAAEAPVAETAAETEQETEQATEPETDKVDFSNKGLKEIVDTFKELIDGDSMQQLYKHAEALKAAFYKNLRKEKIASGLNRLGEEDLSFTLVRRNGGPRGSRRSGSRHRRACLRQSFCGNRERIQGSLRTI